MTDHSELKRLAEAATQGEWGFSGSNIAPLRREKDGAGYVEIWRSVAQAYNPDNAKFIAKASPATVLALIAEVESLKNSHDQICENYNKVSYTSERRGEERDHLKAENKRLSELLECSQGDMRTADKIIKERDRLLSMFDCPDHGQCVPYAMEQVEALRKGAERYQWTATEGNWVARMFGKWRAHVGQYGDANPTEWFDSREEAIDAAITKGAKSCTSTT